MDVFAVCAYAFLFIDEERMQRRKERSARKRSNSLYAEYVRDVDQINLDDEEEEDGEGF